METFVTKHAVKRYRERLVDYSASDQAIINRLKEIAARGEHICWRPSDWNNCVEVKYKGISIVMLVTEEKLVVLTCLGTERYRKWLKHQDGFTRVYQGIRYCNML